MMNQEENATLKLNKGTGYYEAVILKPTLVQVDPELFKRVLKKGIDEDSTADFTDPESFSHIIEKINKATYWLNRPHTQEIPLNEVQSVSQAPEERGEEVPFKTQFELLLDELRERVPNVAPYEWNDVLRTPIPDTISSEAKQPIYAKRNLEKKALEVLFNEWKNEKIHLTQEAQEKQMLHEVAFERRISEKVEAVASASNGNRIR